MFYINNFTKIYHFQLKHSFLGYYQYLGGKSGIFGDLYSADNFKGKLISIPIENGIDVNITVKTNEFIYYIQLIPSLKTIEIEELKQGKPLIKFMNKTSFPLYYCYKIRDKEYINLNINIRFNEDNKSVDYNYSVSGYIIDEDSINRIMNGEKIIIPPPYEGNYSEAYGIAFLQINQKVAEDDILNRGAWDEKSRFAIMNFLENYKTAYALKRLDYISSVFDDDAIIITGRVLRKASKDVILENQSSISHEGNYIIKKNRQTKDEYLKNLERCFRKNEFVNIRFSDNEVRKLREGAGESYAIQIHQDYYSSTYGDKGYLMLFVDINDRTKPLIRLRTWQMEKDPDFGRFYDPDDF